jgi:ABC-type methionine transport system permease subunit
MLVLSDEVSMDGWIGTGLLVRLRLCYGQDRTDMTVFFVKVASLLLFNLEKKRSLMSGYGT